MGPSQPGIEGEGGAKLGDGLIPLRLLGQQTAEIALQHRVHRALGRGLPIAVDGLAAPAEIGQQVAQPDAGGRQIGFRGQGPTIGVDGVDRPARPGQRCRQGRLGRRVFGRQLHRPAKQPDRLAQMPGLRLDHAGQMGGAGMIRISRQEPTADFQRAVALAGAIPAHRLGHCRVGIEPS